MRMRPQYAIALCALSAGCARYTPSPLDPAEAPRAYTALRRDAPGLRDSVAAYAIGASEESSAAYAVTALFARRDLAAAIAEVEAGRASIADVARAAPLGLDGQVERLVYGQSQGAPWAVGFAPSLRVELGGKRAARRMLAEAEVSRREMHARLLAWSIVAEVRRAHLERALAAREEVTVGRVAEVQSVLVAHLQRRATQGELGESEVARATTELRRIETSEAAARRSATDAEAALWRALGMPSPSTQRLPLHIRSACPDEAAQPALREAALRGRYEIGVALADHASADARVRAAVAQGRPDLLVAPGFLWDQGTNRWTLGLGLPEIRLDGNKAGVRAAEAQRRAAIAQVGAAQVAVLRELDEAVMLCRAADAEHQAVQMRTADAGQHLPRARARYLRGEVGAADTLAAAVGVADANLATIAAEARSARAALQVELVAAQWTHDAPARWPTLGLTSDSLPARR